jgi:hypothetical protein
MRYRSLNNISFDVISPGRAAWKKQESTEGNEAEDEKDFCLPFLGTRYRYFAQGVK